MTEAYLISLACDLIKNSRNEKTEVTHMHTHWEREKETCYTHRDIVRASELDRLSVGPFVDDKNKTKPKKSYSKLKCHGMVVFFCCCFDGRRHIYHICCKNIESHAWLGRHRTVMGFILLLSMVLSFTVGMLLSIFFELFT